MADARRDIVVVGASLGGIEALSELVAGLPADFPASMVIVQHTGETSPGMFAHILGRLTPVPVAMATDHAPLQPGIFVAPPGRHVLLTAEGLRVLFGPRENRARPAIDPLFRTAAVHYRSRVIGVVLTGMLGDGAVGLHAIERCGGLCIVQSPGDADAPDMPRRALELVPRAEQVPIGALAPLLSQLVRERAPDPPAVPEMLRIEASITERVMKEEAPAELPGHSTDFTCPDCNGTIHAIDEGGVTRYRCRVGHAYSADAYVAAKDEALEASLWVAQQTMQERAHMLETLGREELARGRLQSSAMFVERARESSSHAQRLRELIQQLAS